MAAAPSRTSARRRWLSVLVVFVVLLALVVTPPLVNVSRLRKRIAASMSMSLGRPVHLDDVSMHILPFPGFTFQNLVVSEDPAFGSEPMIRANTVTARLRLASLWRRQVELSSIHFGIDDNGSGPSVNLVRRADGRWNIESLLVHAAQTEAAPTAQTKAGPAPRFPYIDAEGARINVKNGVDKLPFALTETDFALWLPSPETWRVRLEGKPTRTDVTVNDTGTLRVDATLTRAAHAADVPITVAASWTPAPLGELSRMATGADAGWRGTSEVTATLHGTLGSAALNVTTKLRGLRRADFIPARMLDLDVRCDASLAVATAIVTTPQCMLSEAPHRILSFGESDVPSPTLVTWSAASVDLTGLRTSGAKIMTPGLPADFLLDAVRLATPRVSPALHPAGTVLANFTNDASGWSGTADVTLTGEAQTPAADTHKSTEDAADDEGEHIRATASADELTVAPATLQIEGKELPLTLGATLTREGYRFTLAGTASPQQVAALAESIPALADGVATTAFDTTAPVTATERVNVTCQRAWWSQQTCTRATLPAPSARKRSKRRK